MRKIFGVISVSLAFACAQAHAVTLDWDAVNWAPGSLTNSYNIDPLRAGNDITLAITGNTPQFAPQGGFVTPADLVNIEGGLTPVQQSLHLHVNLADQSQAVTVTVNFSAQYTLGVNNVSFTIFDVDFSNNNFQDQLRTIQATSIDGTTLIAPTITTSVNNTRTGTGINQVVNGITNTADTGATSGNANVTISFGATAIRSFTFTYGSGSTAPANPTNQGISLHDITYTAVPEINPAWISALSCALAAGLILRHRASARK